MGILSWFRELAVRHRARELIDTYGCPQKAREVVARLQADPRLDPGERAFLSSVESWMAERA
jgi:hypothetical protein